VKKEMMIGEFSIGTGISKRMIRFFDDMGILTPMRCDEETGYRYYGENQISIAANIRTLQEYGFSLKEIQDILSKSPQGIELLEILKDQEVKLRGESDKKIGQLLRLKKLIDFTVNQSKLITINNVGEMERSIPMSVQEQLKEALKKLPGEQFLVERLEELCQQEKNSELFFITFDLDHFLEVNDKYGYDVGDRVIERFYAIIRDGFAKLLLKDTKSVLARMGGDEFALILRQVDKEEAIKEIENVIKETQLHDFAEEGCNKTITCSCGVSSKQKILHPIEMIHQSSKALIEAKRKGRNQYQWYVME